MKNTCNFLDFHVDVASLNRRVLENPGQVVALSEENYRYGVAQIAAALQSGEGHYSVVLLAGPSASGKTTTAYKLREQLRKLGTGAHVVSLDNFYKNHDFYPRREDGSIDYESVYALDIDCLHECFHDLITKREADFPIFDFEGLSERRAPSCCTGGKGYPDRGGNPCPQSHFDAPSRQRKLLPDLCECTYRLCAGWEYSAFQTGYPVNETYGSGFEIPRKSGTGHF